MADTIAKGSVVISANADPMVTGLKKAASDADNFTKGLNQRAQNIATGFGAGLIGGGLTEAAKKATEFLIEMVSNAELLNKQLERADKLTEKMAKHTDRIREQQDAIVDAAQDHTQALTDLVALTEREVNGLGRGLANAKKEMNIAADPNMDKWSSWNPFQLLTGDKDFELAKKHVEDVQKLYDSAFERLIKLQGQATKAKMPWEDPENMKATVKGIDDLSDKLAKMGQTDRSNAFADFTKSFPTIEQIEQWNDLYDRLETRQKRFETGFINSQVRSTGILGSILKGAGAAISGLSGLDLKDIKPLGPMFAGALEKGSAEAYSLDVKNRYDLADTTDAAATARDTLAETKRLGKVFDKAYDELRTLNKQLGEAI